jgi:ATP-binding cassette subfamily F protein uup
VVTSTLVFEGNGKVAEYAGGYSDWVRQRPAPVAPTAPKKPAPPATPAPPKTVKPKKLSFKESKELAELPDRIDALEAERDRLFLALADPALLRDGAAVAETRAKLSALEAEIAAATERWEALETIAAAQ